MALPYKKGGYSKAELESFNRFGGDTPTQEQIRQRDQYRSRGRSFPSSGGGQQGGGSQRLGMFRPRNQKQRDRSFVDYGRRGGRVPFIPSGRRYSSSGVYKPGQSGAAGRFLGGFNPSGHQGASGHLSNRPGGKGGRGGGAARPTTGLAGGRGGFRMGGKEMSRPGTGLAGGRRRQPSGGNRGSFNPGRPPSRGTGVLLPPPPQKGPNRRRPSRSGSGRVDPSKRRNPLPRRKTGRGRYSLTPQEKRRRARGRRNTGRIVPRRGGGFIQSRGGRGANRGRSIPGRRRYNV